MNAIILSIGDELILGQTIDTNSAWLSQQLAAVGCEILAHLTVPDDQGAIERAICDCAGRCDVLIISGGIGPTEDDLTRQALAKVMGVELEVNEKWLHQLLAFFRARGREMPETNKIQAMIPCGATMIENTCGTAAGMKALLPLPPGEGGGEGASASRGVFAGEHPLTPTLSRRERGQCAVFVTPGVPKEMKAMFTRDVLPDIAKASNGAVILSRTLHTFGLGESWVAEKLGDLMNRSRNPSVGTTVSQGIVSLRINARFESRQVAQAEARRNHPRLPRRARGYHLWRRRPNPLANRRSVACVFAVDGDDRGILHRRIARQDAYGHPWLQRLFQNRLHHLFQRSQDTTCSACQMELINHQAPSPRPWLKRWPTAGDAGADFALAISGIAGPLRRNARKARWNRLYRAWLIHPSTLTPELSISPAIAK